MARGYAVVDFVTTGLFAAGADRIVELAVVHVDPAGTITGNWTTLVNPERDLGAQPTHGIRPQDVRLAPTFEQIAPELCGLLEGRAVVAHSATFDRGFLGAEFARMTEPQLGIPHHWLSTIALTERYLPGTGRTISQSAATFGIDLGSTDRAAANAWVAARILTTCIAADPGCDDWRAALERADDSRWPNLPPTGIYWVPRPQLHTSELPLILPDGTELPVGTEDHPVAEPTGRTPEQTTEAADQLSSRIAQ
ncbi:3'-5' exonuclease [Glaciihabitans sp. dw_435]|uniref:3'-5' exonuclease n=1 Tax=Glaciihabitans sp. dw_435 TaxID=2720081 RepID=UPI001BD51D3D|nr:3'-5' exonuclease [Glaciihabitans sp. dw_435]